MSVPSKIAAIAILVFISISSAAQLPDTASLDRKMFSDSAAIRRLIDSVYEYKGDDPIKAINLSIYALNRARELKHKNLQAGALNLRGGIHADLRDHPMALQLLYEALRLFESTGYKYGISMVYSNLGRVYTESGKPKDALTYLTKGEDMAREHKLDTVLLHLYLNHANNFVALNQLPQALAYALRVDSLNQRLKMYKIRVSNLNTIGALYYFMADYANALKYYRTAKDESLALKDLTTYHQASVNIGEVYEVTHEQDPLPLYKNALAYFDTIKNHGLVQYTANNISNYYRSQGNFPLALQYYQQSVAAGEKSRNIQSARTMSLIQTQYETEKKEQQISLLNQENTIQKLSIAGRNKTIAVISVLFLLSLIVFALLYNRYRYRQKMMLQQRELQQREALTKAVIEAEEKERKRIASDLHDGVGQLFSAVKLNLSGLFNRVRLDRDEDRFLAEKTLALVDESCKEVRLISHQMMPNMLLRSGIASDVRNFIEKIDSENLKVNLEANGFKNRIESNAETVLYRVIQESVNNVIKHARASQLDIVLNRDANGINVTIADNGVGFDTSLAQEYEGIGLKNIRARIEYLKGTVRYTSAPGQGTKVEIRVPL